MFVFWLIVLLFVLGIVALYLSSHYKRLTGLENDLAAAKAKLMPTYGASSAATAAASKASVP